MAVGKEIRSRIKSVQNTQKITRAMQMVATSKMRKTQERMRSARPYAEKIREVMAHLAEDRLYYARLWVMESEGELFNLQLEKAKPKQIFDKLEELGHAREHLQKRIAEKLTAAMA